MRIASGICIALTLALTGCATTSHKSPAENRQNVLAMKNQVLTELYRSKPDVRAQIASAPGYAVFSNANVFLLLASFGGGHGVVVNNQSGKQTYMKMGAVGVGFGLGVKDFRIVMVFHKAATMKRFIDSGWDFGAQADAAAKASDKGGAVGGEITVDDISIYQLTETGLALQLTIQGTKYWRDDSLN